MDGTQVQKLEKSAGIAGLAKGVGRYLGNVTGRTANKMEKLKGTSRMADHNYKKAVRDSKVAKGLTGAAIVGGAGTVGGVKAYNEPPKVEFESDTITQPDPLKKSAGYQGADLNMHEKLLEQLEKVADETYGPDALTPEEMAILQQQQQSPIPSHEAVVDNLEGYVQNFESPPEETEEEDDGTGAKSVSHAPAGEDKTAHEDMMDRLEKVAGPINFLKDLTGHKVRKVDNIVKRMHLDPNTANMPYDEYQALYDKAQHVRGKAVKQQQKAKDNALLGSFMVGIPAVTGGMAMLAESAGEQNKQREQQELAAAVQSAIAANQHQAAPEEEQTASHEDVVDMLEKVAGPINFMKNVTGHNVRKAENAIRDYATQPENAMLPYRQFNQGQNLLNRDYQHAVKDRDKAQLMGAIGGSAAGALGLSGALAYQEAKHELGKQEEEKQQMAQAIADAIQSNSAPEMQQVAHDDVMDMLEKVAERQDRNVLTETFLGSGPIGYVAKKHNALGINEDDSHSKANAKMGAITGGALGGFAGAKAAMNNGLPVGRNVLVNGAIAGGSMAATGGLIGKLHDRWDRKHPQEEQTASDDLMDKLEKAAANPIPAIGKAYEKTRKFIGDATGKNLQKKTKALDTYSNPEVFKNNGNLIGVSKYRNALENMDKQKDIAKTDMVNARNKVKQGAKAVGAGAVGAAAVTAPVAAVKAMNKDDNQPKVASDMDETMDALFKEAADAIIEFHIPEVKKYVDPINKISFN